MNQKSCKVGNDCHISFNSSRYSVPYQFVGQTVKVRHLEEVIEIVLPDECKRLHKAARGKNQRITVLSDLPKIENIREYEPINKILYQGRLVGENTYYTVSRIFRRKPHPVVNIRSANSILYLVDRYGVEVVEEVLELLLPRDKAYYYRIKFWSEYYLRNRNKSFVQNR